MDAPDDTKVLLGIARQ